MLRTASITCLIIGLAAGSASAQSPDDSAVFDAGLASFGSQFEQRQHVPPRFLIFNETTVVLEQDLGFAGKDLPKQLVNDLLTNNSAPQSIARCSPPAPYRLSSPKLLGAAFESAKPGQARPHYYNWGSLRAQFPDFVGVLEFASPAYSADGTVALLYFWTGCGDLCGSGYLYLLEKSGGHWKVVKTFSPWVS
jgi:hypothetical protein